MRAAELVVGAVTRPWEALAVRPGAPAPTATAWAPVGSQTVPCRKDDETGRVRAIPIPCGPNLPPGAR